MRILQTLALASLVVMAGCGFSGGGKTSNSYQASVTTTPTRVENTGTTPPLMRYSGVEVTNLAATPINVGGPIEQGTTVCSDTAACKSASIYVPGSDVWVESTSGTVANVQFMLIGQ